MEGTLVGLGLVVALAAAFAILSAGAIVVVVMRGARRRVTSPAATA